MVNKDKKFIINEGRAITNGKFAYGGFPRILNEENNSVTDQFQDSPKDGQVNVATKPNSQESLVADPLGLNYPSSDYAKLARALESALTAERQAGYRIQGHQNRNAPQEAHAAFAAAKAAREAAQRAIEAHPEHAAFVQKAKDFNTLVRGGNYGE